MRRKKVPPGFGLVELLVVLVLILVVVFGGAYFKNYQQQRQTQIDLGQEALDRAHAVEKTSNEATNQLQEALNE